MAERAVPDPVSTPGNLEETGRIADEKADKPDRYGEWLADDARIWRVYGQLAKEDDKERVQRWSGGLNSLAIFAALFSGITTAFIIESQGDLKPDFAELAYRVQNATAHGHAYVEEPFVVPRETRLVNCLWITSLLLSLSAALIAIMGQDWVEMYVDKPVCNARQWAEIRSFRINGVYRWYMPGVIATAPVLLHASLFLFGIGLVVFMASDFIIQKLCIALCVTVAILYTVTMFSPVLWPSSPFRSPATMLVRRWFCLVFHRRRDVYNFRTRSDLRRRLLANCAAAAPVWMRSCFHKTRMTFNCIHCPNFTNGWTEVLHRWFRALFQRRLTEGTSGQDPVSQCPATHGADLPAHAPRPLPRPPLPPRRRLAEAFPPFPATHGAELPAHAPRPLPRPPLPPPRRLAEAVPPFPATHCAEPLTHAPRAQSSPLTRLQNYLSVLCAAFNRILDLCRPDFSNGWTEVLDWPSPPRVADSLFWLSSASHEPEVAQLIVLGLCDHVTGQRVCRLAMSWRMIENMRRHAENEAERQSLHELCRYLLIHGPTGRTRWPAHVQQRFKDVIDEETPVSEEFLLALVHLTNGFRGELKHSGNRWRTPQALFITPDTLQQLCARIEVCTPITVTTVASIITQVHGESSFSGNSHPLVEYLIVIMSRWCNVMPADLHSIFLSLESVAPEEVRRSTRSTSRSCWSSPRPIDEIVHLLIAFFVRRCSLDAVSRSTLDLILGLARAATANDGHSTPHSHVCLAMIFGDGDPRLTKAAWHDRSEHDVETAMASIITPRHRALPDIRFNLRPHFARMLVRSICPPLPLVVAKTPGVPPLARGCSLFDLVTGPDSYSLPDDLLRPMLQQPRALIHLSQSLREDPTQEGRDERGKQLWYTLAAISSWICRHRSIDTQVESFKLFALSPVSGTSHGAVWNLANALTSALIHVGWGSERRGSGSRGSTDKTHNLFSGVRHFTTGLKNLREMFPNNPLWKAIARRVGTHKARFPESDWPGSRDVILKATGIDPMQFAGGEPGASPDIIMGDDIQDGASATTDQVALLSRAANPNMAAISVSWLGERAAGEMTHGGP